jgi:hypothetical protein
MTTECRETRRVRQVPFEDIASDLPSGKLVDVAFQEWCYPKACKILCGQPSTPRSFPTNPAEYPTVSAPGSVLSSPTTNPLDVDSHSQIKTRSTRTLQRV